MKKQKETDECSECEESFLCNWATKQNYRIVEIVGLMLITIMVITCFGITDGIRMLIAIAFIMLLVADAMG